MSAQQNTIMESSSDPQGKPAYQSDEMDNPNEEKATADEFSDDELKEKLEGATIHYSITCTDDKNRRTKQFMLPDNPFESLIHKKKPPASRVVIVVFVNAYGFGSSRDWTSINPGVRSGPPGRDFPGSAARFDSDSRRTLDPNAPLAMLPNSSDSDTSSEHGNGVHYSESGRRYRHRSSKRGQTPQYPGFDIGRFKPMNVFVNAVEIRSKRLIKLFQDVVREYPTQSFKGDGIMVDHPYKLLAHYYKDLEAVANQPLSDSSSTEEENTNDPVSTDIAPILDQDTKSDLDVLLNWFKPFYEKAFEPEALLHRTGAVSYKHLWFLFRPGSTVYAKIGGKIAGFVFATGEDRMDRLKDRYEWLAHCWNLSYNGRRVVRTVTTFTIRRFEGVKPITSLQVYPSSYLDATDGGKTKSRLEELGDKYYKLLRASPEHMYYSGPCWDMKSAPRNEDAQKFLFRKPVAEYTGEVIIDHRRSKTYGDRSPSPDPGPYYDRDDRVYYTSSDEEDSDEEEYNRRRGVPLDTRTPRKTLYAISPKDDEKLTPQHYFLLPRRMDGFALVTKKEMGYDIEYLQPMVWPAKGVDPMNNLILGDSDKDVIKALARKYSKNEGAWGADFIQGKGEGQIFLLHGPPGTGKTYTVECVAKFTQRPLLRLTVADIGTDERDMESVLGEWFKRGADWGAIILIDEADVFLEKRQVKDLQRNSLVSVFLSAMEYYTGMLFLTTNRIGQIDDAFLSRTSVALTYETLDIGKQQKIWEGFLKKLSEERKDIALTNRAKKFLEGLDKDTTTRDVPWNGREIRNALQTAIALASYDAEKDAEATGVEAGRIQVRDEHFQAVVDRRKDFIAYRKSIRNQDEEVRAYSEGNRAPPKKNG